MSTSKVGRPPQLGTNPQSKHIKFPRDEFRRMSKAAQADGMDLSSWIRGVIERALNRRKRG